MKPPESAAARGGEGKDTPALSPVRTWILASRPKTLTAAAAPVVAGTGLAAHRGTEAALPALAALVGALLIQITTNLANDYYDFVHGGDTHERVGPLRVTQAGLLSPKAVKWGTAVTAGAALLVGIYLAWVGGWPIIVAGLASLACAVLYTGGPYPLAYHGLGEVFVFIFFGLIAVGGTLWVQGGVYPADALLVGVAMGALITDILVVNNLRDIDTDARTGKRTLAVRLGATGTKVEFLVLLAVAFVVPVFGFLRMGWPPATLATLLVLPFTVAPARRVLDHTRPEELLPALGQTSRVVALYGAVMGLTLALG